MASDYAEVCGERDISYLFCGSDVLKAATQLYVLIV